MSVISAGTTTTTAFKVTGDTTGTLQLQTGAVPTTAINISATQVVTFPATTTLDFTGTLLLGDGSAAAPTLAHSGDTNTGMFFPAADTIAFTEGGTEVLRLNSSAQVAVNTAGTAAAPVITKTDDLNTGIFFPAADTIAFSEGGVEALRIDSSANVGIGTSSPAYRLDVQNPAATTWLRIGNAAINSGAAIIFNGASTQKNWVIASQYNVNGGLEFTQTTAGGGSVIGSTPAMTLDANGYLTVGTTNNGELGVVVSGGAKTLASGIPQYQFQAQDTTAMAAGVGGAINFTGRFTSGGATTSFASIEASKENATSGQFGAAMVFKTRVDGGGQIERARFNSTGAFVFAGGTTTANGIGITFPATQSASSNANTLDDYEEGTWSPRIENAAGSTVVTLTNQGIYTKVGQMVHVQINAYSVSVSAFGATEHLYLAGLPFTSANSIYVLTFNTYVNQPVWAIDGGANTKFQLWVPASAVDYAIFTRNTWGGSATMTFRGNFVYEAS